MWQAGDARVSTSASGKGLSVGQPSPSPCCDGRRRRSTLRPRTTLTCPVSSPLTAQLRSWCAPPTAEQINAHDDLSRTGSAARCAQTRDRVCPMTEPGIKAGLTRLSPATQRRGGITLLRQARRPFGPRPRIVRRVRRRMFHVPQCEWPSGPRPPISRGAAVQRGLPPAPDDPVRPAMHWMLERGHCRNRGRAACRPAAAECQRPFARCGTHQMRPLTERCPRSWHAARRLSGAGRTPATEWMAVMCYGAIMAIAIGERL